MLWAAKRRPGLTTVNKFIFTILLSLPNFALAVPQPVNIVLQLRAHHGSTNNYHLVWSAREITINGISIAPQILPAVAGPLSILSKPKNDFGGECGSGTFIHQVANGKKIRQGRGCLSSKTAQLLVDSMRKIESLSYLRRLPSGK